MNNKFKLNLLKYFGLFTGYQVIGDKRKITFITGNLVEKQEFGKMSSGKKEIIG